MLDVITIVSETTPAAWIAQCRRSVAGAIELAGYPVRHLEAPGVPGHIGRAMANSLAQSTAPYVAWVDDDDFVLPHAFSCLQPYFTGVGIFAREMRLYANGQFQPFMPRHHLAVYSRDIVEATSLRDLAAHPNVELHKAASAGVDVMSWVYVRRIWRSAGMQVRAKRT